MERGSDIYRADAKLTECINMKEIFPTTSFTAVTFIYI